MCLFEKPHSLRTEETFVERHISSQKEKMGINF